MDYKTFKKTLPERIERLKAIVKERRIPLSLEEQNALLDRAAHDFGGTIISSNGTQKVEKAQPELKTGNDA